MLPTKLAIDIARRNKLYDATPDKEAAHQKVYDAIADVQKMAAAGMDLPTCVGIFKTWMLSSKQSRSKKPADELITLSDEQTRGLELIHETTIPQMRGQVIGALAKIAEGSLDDKQRIEAARLLDEIVSGDVDSNVKDGFGGLHITIKQVEGESEEVDEQD
ncbi:MAG: hypothetical protein GY774_04920 [Planctomycetes bacterium]|nr:hypothetical protein [Planctomycetota bacterium]